jgi:hypothetical protein
MSKEEIIKKAEKNLPYVSEVNCNYYVIPVENMDYSFFGINSNEPSPLNKSLYFAVRFRKQILSGVVIGWEFDAIENI